MSCAFTVVLLFYLAVMSSFPADAVNFQAYKPPVEAKVNDVATGTVVRQDAKTLILNTSPCSGDQRKQIVIFHYPFETKQAAPATCPGGKSFQQITANQK
jgi:hypothetical protein